MRTVVPHNRLSHDAAEVAAVSAVVGSGRWAGGPTVLELERVLAAQLGRKHAAAVGSGLGALRLSLLALSVGRDDEVIIPAYSCVALANAVLACGARPIVADVTPGDWNIDPSDVQKAIGPHTRAIIAVHTFGLPAPVADLKALGIPVIEDCAHGIAEARMGQQADIAITSFYATKLIGAGEGGAVLSDRSDVDEFVRQSRDYGDQHPDSRRLNDKMTDVVAAIAVCQLRKLDNFVARRSMLAERYHQALQPLCDKGYIRLPYMSQARVWYRYAVENLAPDLDLIGRLSERGVSAAQPVWDWRRQEGRRCPAASDAYRNLVSLPLYPTLSFEEQSAVIDAMFNILAA